MGYKRLKKFLMRIWMVLGCLVLSGSIFILVDDDMSVPIDAKVFKFLWITGLGVSVLGICPLIFHVLKKMIYGVAFSITRAILDAKNVQDTRA